MFQTIFCDIDGVIADFHLEAVRAHMRIGNRFALLDHHGTPLELSHQRLYSRWPPGMSCHRFCTGMVTEVEDLWSPEMDGFWRPIRSDPFFWQNMPALPWAKQLLKLLEGYCKEIVYVTTPDWTPDSHAGKLSWLAVQKMPQYEYITMKNKWRLARPNCLLIDDFEKHVERWQEKDCPALLFPQPWNEDHHFVGDRLGFVRKYLEDPTNDSEGV